MDQRIIRFEGPWARFQYRLLMVLYSLVFNRWLYGIFCRFLAKFFNSENKVVLNITDDREFRVYLNDGYWTRFYLYHKTYETEVQRVLECAQGTTTLFCDLGANSGLWSVYGSALFERVIAVEASKRTFMHLEENLRPLQNVEALQSAVFKRTGDKMQFVNVYNSHASAHLHQGGSTGEFDQYETVGTVRIDDLVPNGLAALIKLDVEGAEIAAIDGGSRAIHDGCAFIYEDHGSDLKSEVSRHLMQMGDISVYSIEDDPVLIQDIDQLARLKTDRYKGYNFLAARRDSELMAGILENFANARSAG